MGNLGGYIGPTAMGHIEKATGSFHGGIYFLAGTALTAGLLVVVLRAVHLRAALPQSPTRAAFRMTAGRVRPSPRSRCPPS